MASPTGKRADWQKLNAVSHTTSPPSAVSFVLRRFAVPRLASVSLVNLCSSLCLQGLFSASNSIFSRLPLLLPTASPPPVCYSVPPPASASFAVSCSAQVLHRFRHWAPPPLLQVRD
ncbi:hypothetical protein PIB30_046164 [Stylosanthes scabra]|uniref:Transmembrane protein n=1 Tax=Stylosanthes scabra TaxID=79078 RepID=A0ABU6VJ79_9FABA|nr:hypothetical protein [Stylosanthes scabra]